MIEGYPKRFYGAQKILSYTLDGQVFARVRNSDETDD
jgi:hypothetical protein